jgi:cold shock CspA family protein
MTGTIKKLVSDRGFGFIQAEDGNGYFLHAMDLQIPFEDLNESDNVTFETMQNPNWEDQLVSSRRIRPAETSRL